MSDLGKKRDCTVYVAKRKVLVICTFAFHVQKAGYRDTAQIKEK